ncbi:MAG: SPFH domain-containing protein [Planctomycetota bacterium]
MNNPLRLVIRIAIFAVVVIPLLLFATSFNVRFTEAAVKTRFGEAGEGAVITEPGFKWKLPAPFESVTKYDTRGRFVQTRSTSVQTEDRSEVIIEAFAVWRVQDPLVFYQRFSKSGPRADMHFEAGEEAVRSRMFGALSEISNYSLDDLFTPVRGQSQLPALEQDILRRLRGEATDEQGGLPLDQYGIEVAAVGINRLVVPASTTEKIIQRMGESRDRIANEIQTQGNAQASAILARAGADAAKIRAFAERRADEIRARGEQEAAEFYAEQNAEPALAQFLAKVEAMKKTAAERFTLVVSEDDFGFELFSPSAVNGAGNGIFPGRGLLDPDLATGTGSRTGSTAGGDE